MRANDKKNGAGIILCALNFNFPPKFYLHNLNVIEALQGLYSRKLYNSRLEKYVTDLRSWYWMHVTNIGEILKFFIYMIGIDNEGNHNDMICSYTWQNAA